MHILITGARGNVGMEVITAISSLNHQHEVYALVREVQKKEAILDKFPKIKRKEFTFLPARPNSI